MNREKIPVSPPAALAASWTCGRGRPDDGRRLKDIRHLHVILFLSVVVKLAEEPSRAGAMCAPLGPLVMAYPVTTDRTDPKLAWFFNKLKNFQARLV